MLDTVRLLDITAITNILTEEHIRNQLWYFSFSSHLKKKKQTQKIAEIIAKKCLFLFYK